MTALCTVPFLRTASLLACLGSLASAWAGPTPVVAQAVAAVASRVEFVTGPAPPRRPEQGLLVLDLHGLESAEAALTMAQHWRQRHGSARPITCWLANGSRGLTADALGALLQADEPPCDRILVPR